MNDGTTKDFIDSLTAKERTDLLAGLKRFDQQRTASDALLVASLLESHLRILGFKEYAERVAHIKEHVHKLT